MEKNGLAGSTSLLVLSLLRDGDKYGYEMISQLDLRSEGVFELKEGTLYPLLHTLEKNHLVSSYTKAGPGGRERKYYKLTDEGREQLETKKKEWQLFSEKVNSVLGTAHPALA